MKYVPAHLAHLEIHPRANGKGFNVVHHFKPRLAVKRGAMSGGISTQKQPAAVHEFGPGQNTAMIAHIAQALGIQNGESDQGQEDNA
jgi:hypothetical protein